ncbi:MAG: HAMP domain-containing protein [Anaerolineaceae bacterium]|nr:HAMP domain-containing protein [Anaerolineaceae bacterium]
MSKKKWESMSLRQRIVWLTCGAVFGIGLLLVLFVNLIAPIFITHEIGSPDTEILINTVDASGNPITILAETPGPAGYTIWHDPGFIRADPLFVIRILSVVGLILITAAGIFAARAIAKESLKPVALVSDTARQISVHNLDQRLNYQGESDEIKTLADSFDRMLGRLQLNFEDQSEFISNLAHELRTPLTSLRMNLEVLNSNPQAKLEDYQTFSAIAGRSITRLEHLVEDLLLLAKAEKEIDRRPVVLGVLFEDILEELALIAEKENIDLKMSGDLELTVSADAVLLHRALANLIENGLYYNHPGGFVEVSAQKTEHQVIIEVQDSGIGISKDQLAHIFERFYRAETRVINHDGKGLGLAITAHIVALHNGRIEVKSEVGKGSVFTIFLGLP